MQVKTKGLVKVDTFKKWNKLKIKVGCRMAANSWLLLHSSEYQNRTSPESSENIALNKTKQGKKSSSQPSKLFKQTAGKAPNCNILV